MKTQKIRVLYLVSRLRRVGPIFQLYNIIKNLDRDRFIPHIITLSPEIQISLIDSFRNINVQCHSIGLPSITGMVFGPQKIRKILRCNPADLIHASDYRSILLCATNFAHLPRIVTCRQAFDYSHYNLDGIFNPISARVIVMTLGMACKKCERVVAVSNFVRCSKRNGLAERMTVIYNGVDQDAFSPINKEQKASLRSKLNLPHDKHVFLSVGFLSKRKDPVTVIKAFLQYSLDRRAFLVFLGDGPLRYECLRLANMYDNIRIAGFAQNIRDYLGAADTFVSASQTEGCPNAVMEAMACGLPVILSDIPAHREILDFNKKAGLLFSTKDIDSLSNVFSICLDGDYSEKSEAALSIINNHLNAKNMSLKYQELYTELCR